MLYRNSLLTFRSVRVTMQTKKKLPAGDPVARGKLFLTTGTASVTLGTLGKHVVKEC